MGKFDFFKNRFEEIKPSKDKISSSPKRSQIHKLIRKSRRRFNLTLPKQIVISSPTFSPQNNEDSIDFDIFLDIENDTLTYSQDQFFTDLIDQKVDENLVSQKATQLALEIQANLPSHPLKDRNCFIEEILKINEIIKTFKWENNLSRTSTENRSSLSTLIPLTISYFENQEIEDQKDLYLIVNKKTGNVDFYTTNVQLLKLLSQILI